MSMCVDDRTSKLNLPLPHVRNDMTVDCARLREALGLLDTAMGALGASVQQMDSTLATEIEGIRQAGRDLTDEIIAEGSQLLGVLSTTPAPNRAPRAGADGKLDSAWLTVSSDQAMAGTGDSGFLTSQQLRKFMPVPKDQSIAAGESGYVMPAGKSGAYVVVPGVGLYAYDAASTALVDGQLVCLPLGGDAAVKGRWILQIPGWLLCEEIERQAAGVRIDAHRACQAVADNIATVLPKTVTGTLSFGTIAAAGVSTATISVEGAAMGRAVVVTPPASVAAIKLVGWGYVSAPGVVTVCLFNGTASAVAPAAAVYTVSVL